MTPDFIHQTSARTPKALAVVLAVWTVLAASFFFLSAAWWIVAFFVAATIPAVIDLVKDRPAGMTITQRDWHWHSGRAGGPIPLAEIKNVRMDTRLDLSIRVTVFPRQGRGFRLPFDTVPKPDALETALRDRNITVERHHFSLLG